MAAIMQSSNRHSSFSSLSMSSASSSPRPPADDSAIDRALEVELLMSTHMTVVVRARVEFADADELCDTGLVIARSR